MPLRMAGRRAFYPSALWDGGVVSSRSGRARGCQNLWHPYLWNRLTDFLRSKFCGIVLPCSCALLWSYAHLLAHRPKTCQICHKLASDVVARISLKLLDGFSPFEVSWTCQIRQHLGQTCGTYISETTGWIYTIQSSMELSRPVVVQQHRQLTLTLDFQGQILKMLYLRNGRTDQHGTKGIWVDMVLCLLCDLQLWPWTWIFKVKFWNCCI